MRGKFITLEGGEGAGKTTLIKALQAALAAKGLDVVVTREPGGTPGAEVLRDILLKGATDRWSPVTEALLMYAARVDHVERLIEPALARGAWVISDRFADSTMAYQGTAGGVPLDRIRQLHGAALGDFRPDLTLVLDLDPRTGLERTVARGEDATRFERFDADFHARLRQAFLDIAAREPERCVVLDAGSDADAVAAAALQAIETRLGAPA
ncbi:dTMP kinase [Maricaulis sp.]|uniref:dTMP kinase n=1 Tax=Maricaulis sp. TaxID=1486257 RepID=UPI00329A3987